MEYLTTLTSPVDVSKPSLFELLSEAQLHALIPPSIRYLLALATHRHPRYLLRILNNFDEVYAGLSLLIEKYFLQTYGGSFTENFYALKREKVLSLGEGAELRRTQIAVPSEIRERLKLRGKDIWTNLAVLVGIPYLKRKLDESYDIHIAPSQSLLSAASGIGGPRYLDRDALPANATYKQRFMYYYKWFLRNIYPSVNAAYYFSILAFSLGYLFDGTKYSSPFLWLIGTRMRRMGEADYRAIEEATTASAARLAKEASGRAGQGLAGIFHPKVLIPRLLSGLKLLLPVSIFALKFLEWWHASDFSRQLSRKAAETLELPPPVVSGLGQGRKQIEDSQNLKSKSSNHKASSSSKQNLPQKSTAPISTSTRLPILTIPAPASSDLCPICLHPIDNATACQTGYVFDYKCIFQWIEGTHERQEAWMRGEKGSEWADDEENSDEDEDDKKNEKDDEKSDANKMNRSREGLWESGKGRCAVTGRRVLGGTSGLRRVLV